MKTRLIGPATLFLSLAAVFLTLFICLPLHAETTEGRKDLLPLGAQAPVFSLPDVVTGRAVSLDDLKDKKVLLVIFMCRHCPYVQHIKKELAKLARDYAGQDIAIVGISANDPAGYPEDSPDKLKAMALEEGFTFPLLFDETQLTARAYTAVATPDLFLFDASRKLVYRGQFDGSRPMSLVPVSGSDIRAAIDAVLNDQPVALDQKPAVGCSIKWKKSDGARAIKEP